PRALSKAFRDALELASPITQKAMPFDARAFRAERLRKGPMPRQADRIGKRLGVRDVRLLVTDLAPRICVPVLDSPVTIVVGYEIAARTTEAERAFLFARAIETS